MPCFQSEVPFKLLARRNHAEFQAERIEPSSTQSSQSKKCFLTCDAFVSGYFFLPILPREKKKASAYRPLSFSPCLSERGHASPNLLLLISQEPHARSLAATRARLLCARKFYICRWICHVALPSRLSLCRSWRRRYVLVIFKFPPQYGSARDNVNAS